MNIIKKVIMVAIILFFYPSFLFIKFISKAVGHLFGFSWSVVSLFRGTIGTWPLGCGDRHSMYVILRHRLAMEQ